MRGTDTPPTRRSPPAEDMWSGLEPEFVRDAAAVRLKALGHPERLRIVEALSHASMNVGQIGSLVGISRSAASRHLRLLADADVVRSSRQGNLVVYALADRDAARLAAIAYRGAGAQARRRLSINRPS